MVRLFRSYIEYGRMIRKSLMVLYLTGHGEVPASVQVVGDAIPSLILTGGDMEQVRGIDVVFAVDEISGKISYIEQAERYRFAHHVPAPGSETWVRFTPRGGYQQFGR